MQTPHLHNFHAPVSVSPPSFDTYMLTEYVCTLHENLFLDMGSGSGYVAVTLAKQGKDCTATDISEYACEVTSYNAHQNNVLFPIIQSDLFENVSGLFEVIMFNPPYASVHHKKASKVLEWIKSLVPRNNKIIAEVVFFFVRPQRRVLLERFFAVAREHLTESGFILVLVHHKELKQLLERYDGSYTVGSVRWMRLLRIPASALQK